MGGKVTKRKQERAAREAKGWEKGTKMRKKGCKREAEGVNNYATTNCALR